MNLLIFLWRFSTQLSDEEKMKSPVQKLTLDEIEQRAAYEIACGDVGSTVQYPVTAYQVLEALQVSSTAMLFLTFVFVLG